MVDEDTPAWGRLLMAVTWPAFLAACLLEAAVFAVVDPLELAWGGGPLGWSRQAVYTAAFFLFWASCMLASVGAVCLLRSEGPQPLVRAE
jgi:hypothetical protein